MSNSPKKFYTKDRQYAIWFEDKPFSFEPNPNLTLLIEKIDPLIPKTKVYVKRDPETGKLKFVRGWLISSTDSQGITGYFKHNPEWDGPIEKYMAKPNCKVKPIFDGK